MIKINPNSHLISNIPYLESQNCDARPEGVDIDTIIIHCISLPDGEYGNDNVINLFQNDLDISKNESFQSLEGVKVSSHIFIRRDGEVIQFVPFNLRAWHAGTSMHIKKSNCNDFSIGIELEGSVSSKFSENQYKILIELIATLKSNYPKIRDSNIIGHNEIAPNRKEDPGKFFDWERIKGLKKQ